jgi:hypothetical protein
MEQLEKQPLSNVTVLDSSKRYTLPLRVLMSPPLPSTPTMDLSNSTFGTLLGSKN